MTAGSRPRARSRLTWSVGLVLGALLVLTACGDDGAAPTGPEESAPPSDVEEVVTIEPLASIDGAERMVVEGVGVDVPDGVQAGTSELSDTVTQLVLTSEGQERADLVLTVTRDEGVSDSDVFLTMRGTQTQLSPEAAPETSEIGVEWSGFDYATGLRGRVDPGGGDLHEFMYVVTRDGAGTRIITVSVEAAEGAVEDSRGYEMLRTVRVDEG